MGRKAGARRPLRQGKETFSQGGAMFPRHILLVAEVSPYFRALAADLTQQGHKIFFAAPDRAQGILEHQDFALVIVELGRTCPAGLRVVEKALGLSRRPLVLAIGREGEGLPASVFRLEVDDYLELPFCRAEMGRRISLLLTPPVARDDAASQRRAAALNYRLLLALSRHKTETYAQLQALAAALHDLATLAPMPPRGEAEGLVTRMSAHLETLFFLLGKFPAAQDRSPDQNRSGACDLRGVVIDLPPPS